MKYFSILQSGSEEIAKEKALEWRRIQEKRAKEGKDIDMGYSRGITSGSNFYVCNIHN